MGEVRERLGVPQISTQISAALWCEVDVVLQDLAIRSQTVCILLVDDGDTIAVHLRYLLLAQLLSTHISLLGVLQADGDDSLKFANWA